MSANSCPVAIWDAREYFTIVKDDDKVFAHENVASLPRYERDLEFGDLALVYHSVSTFDAAPTPPSSDKAPPYNEAKTILSMNLYGVALIAKYDSKGI